MSSKRSAEDGDFAMPPQRRVITECMEGVISERKHTHDPDNDGARKRMAAPRSDERELVSLDDLRSMLAAQLTAREADLRAEYTGHFDQTCADMYTRFIQHQRDSVDVSTGDNIAMNSYVS